MFARKSAWSVMLVGWLTGCAGELDLEGSVAEVTPLEAGDGGATAPALSTSTVDPRATRLLGDVSRRYLDGFSSRAPSVWAEAATLEALLTGYEATRDRRLLDEAIVHLDVLVDTTGTQSGYRDVVRAGAQPAWGTDRYSCGHFFTHAVHTGILAHPLVWFARIVAEDGSLGGTIRDRAAVYLDTARRALDVHRGEFAATDTGGYYRHPTYPSALASCEEKDYVGTSGTPLPFNMMLAMGRAHLEIARTYEAQGRDGSYHLDRATRLARYFKSNLTLSGDRYVWKYVAGGRSEDASHGSIDVRFVLQAHAEGVVFTATDLSRFARTFAFLTARTTHVASHVEAGYGGEYDQRWQQGVVQWAGLARTDPSIWFTARDVYYNGDGKSVLATALLIRHAPDEKIYATRGESYSPTLVADRPMRAVGAGATGLYRSATMPLSTLSGRSVSSCARYVFERPEDGPLLLRYRHTSRPIAGDSCSGTYCGTPPGILVGLESSGVIRWLDVPRVTAEYSTHRVAVPEPFRQVVVCRSGAGAARDNLDLRLVATE